MQWLLKSSNPDIVKYVRDSTGKGNYSGTQVGGDKLILTGSNDNYKVNNIYDMAGNCWEWMIEANGSSDRSLCGGYCTNDATSNPASCRSGYVPCGSGTDYSSRTTLIM